MKKLGILNSDISKVLSDLGHTDTICISDCGLPVPTGVKKIDLSIYFGNPKLETVLRAIVNDMVFEETILAAEIIKENREINNTIRKIVNGKTTTYVSHEQFKSLTKNCKAIIRTGECTPYANIILVAGVNFGIEE